MLPRKPSCSQRPSHRLRQSPPIARSMPMAASRVADAVVAAVAAGAVMTMPLRTARTSTPHRRKHSTTRIVTKPYGNPEAAKSVPREAQPAAAAATAVNPVEPIDVGSVSSVPEVRKPETSVVLEKAADTWTAAPAQSSPKPNVAPAPPMAINPAPAAVTAFSLPTLPPIPDQAKPAATISEK